MVSCTPCNIWGLFKLLSRFTNAMWGWIFIQCETGCLPIWSSNGSLFYFNIMKLSCLSIFLQSERSARQVNSLACKLTKTNNSQRHQLTNLLTRKLINSQSHQLPGSSTHKSINSQAHQLPNSSTHLLRRLNIIFYFTKWLLFSLRSSENLGHKVSKKILFFLFGDLGFVCF